MSTVKKVNRYQCDFCNTKKYSKSAINKHEKHCTKNPERHCRMCDSLFGGQKSLDALKKHIPDPIWNNIEPDEFLDIGKVVNIESINESIINAINNELGCPICIMAALRQKNIPIPMTSFDYKGEKKEAFGVINDQKSNQYLESEIYRLY